MLITNPEFLNPDIYRTDDRPRVWRGAISLGIVTWQDAQDALNQPWNHIVTVIGDDGKRMELDTVEEPWWYKGISKKEELFHLANSGYTVNICQYGHGNTHVEHLLAEIEQSFDGCCDCHIFITNGKDNRHPSFSPHWDHPSNFIIQMEGHTRWQVYKNRASALIPLSDTNAQVSPDDLEIDIDTVLNPGDLLYFPSRAYHNTRHTLGSRLSLSIPLWSPKRCECSDRSYYTLDRS